MVSLIPRSSCCEYSFSSFAENVLSWDNVQSDSICPFQFKLRSLSDHKLIQHSSRIGALIKNMLFYSGFPDRLKCPTYLSFKTLYELVFLLLSPPWDIKNRIQQSHLFDCRIVSVLWNHSNDDLSFLDQWVKSWTPRRLVSIRLLNANNAHISECGLACSLIYID